MNHMNEIAPCSSRAPNLPEEPAHLENNEHIQSDLGTAAFLVVRRFSLLGLKLVGTGRFGFRFRDPEGGAAAAAMAYLRGDSVPAKQLIAAERDLKTLLYSKKNGNENGKSSVIPDRHITTR